MLVSVVGCNCLCCYGRKPINTLKTLNIILKFKSTALNFINEKTFFNLKTFKFVYFCSKTRRKESKFSNKSSKPTLILFDFSNEKPSMIKNSYFAVVWKAEKVENLKKTQSKTKKFELS